MASILTQTTTTTRASWLDLSSGQQTLLKWLATLLMLLDHANRSLWVFQPWAFALGRIAFPLFGFLIAYNLAVRKVDADKYVKPLLLFGMISQLPAMLALDREIMPLNNLLHPHGWRQRLPHTALVLLAPPGGLVVAESELAGRTLPRAAPGF